VAIISPVPEFRTRDVTPAALPTVIVLSPCVPMLIAWSISFIPIPIVDVLSRVIAPLASKSKAIESISIAASAVLPISIPLVPSSANTPPAFISTPPAVAVTAIASVASPVVLINYIFSLAGVSCVLNTI